MPWYALLIVALVSLAVVIVGVAYLALKAWRLFKRGLRVSRDIAPLADHLSRQAEVLSANAERLAANGEQLSANITRLQVSLARLQVIANTLSEVAEPYLRLTGWLSGERGW